MAIWSRSLAPEEVVMYSPEFAPEVRLPLSSEAAVLQRQQRKLQVQASCHGEQRRSLLRA